MWHTTCTAPIKLTMIYAAIQRWWGKAEEEIF